MHSPVLVSVSNTVRVELHLTCQTLFKNYDYELNTLYNVHYTCNDTEGYITMLNGYSKLSIKWWDKCDYIQ